MSARIAEHNHKMNKRIVAYQWILQDIANSLPNGEISGIYLGFESATIIWRVDNKAFYHEIEIDDSFTPIFNVAGDYINEQIEDSVTGAVKGLLREQKGQK